MSRPHRHTLRLVPALLLCLMLRPAAGQPIHRPVLLRVAPTYPELARRMHVAGTVVVQVSVRPDGTVSDTHTQSGHALLSMAAEDAVKRWHFAPATETSHLIVDVDFVQ